MSITLKLEEIAMDEALARALLDYLGKRLGLVSAPETVSDESVTKPATEPAKRGRKPKLAVVPEAAEPVEEPVVEAPPELTLEMIKAKGSEIVAKKGAAAVKAILVDKMQLGANIKMSTIPEDRYAEFVRLSDECLKE